MVSLTLMYALGNVMNLAWAALIVAVLWGVAAAVLYSTGRAAYARTPWPKAFLTLLGRAHGDYLGPGARAFDPMIRTVVDFLRWSLYGDTAAGARLDADATAPGVTSYEARLSA